MLHCAQAPEYLPHREIVQDLPALLKTSPMISEGYGTLVHILAEKYSLVHADIDVLLMDSWPKILEQNQGMLIMICKLDSIGMTLPHDAYLYAMDVLSPVI